MKKTRIKLLLIDDDEEEFFILKKLLAKINHTQYDLKWIADFDDGLVEILKKDCDAYLVDYQLGEKDGLKLIRSAIKSGCNLPLILLTGHGSRKVDLAAMEAGATDYLIKNELNSLLLERTIRYAIEHKESEESLVHMVRHDHLTDLANRYYFEETLNKSISIAKRENWHLALLYLDLDKFKDINDTLGHNVGDLLLIAVSKRLHRCIREADTIARFGGDEFGVILTRIRHPYNAALVAKSLIQTLKKPFILNDNEVFVGVSIGIAIYPNAGENAKDLIRHSDLAMYSAKRKGSNSYQFYTPKLQSMVEQRVSLEHKLHNALKNNEFYLCYQPQIDIVSNRIVGLEALMRWHNDEIGNVEPVNFIPMLEESGQILEVGEWILRTACQQYTEWGNNSLRLAINISAHQVFNPSFIDQISALMKDFPPLVGHLELEITESVMIQDLEDAISKFLQLSDLGVSIAIDDFGTGYSSLMSLKKFPVRAIKIDRSFIKDINIDDDNTIIVRSTILLAHSLNLHIIAEGVETKEQLTFLEEHHCDQYQGYYFSKPVKADVITKILKKS